MLGQTKSRRVTGVSQPVSRRCPTAPKKLLAGSLLTYDQPLSPLAPPPLLQHTPLPSRLAAPGLQQRQHQPSYESTQPAVEPQQQQQRAQRARDLRQSVDTVGSQQMSREFSGFTVYTNKLHDSAELGEVAAPGPAAAGAGAGAAGEAPAGGGEGSEARCGSAVAWRDISSAVEASLSSADFDRLRGSHDGAGEGGAGGAGAEPQQPAALPEGRQAQMQRMARLVLPTLDASQLDSLVRIGASLPSPEMLMSPEVLSQLLPRLWDGSAAPPPEGGGPASPEVQQLLEELRGGAGGTGEPAAQQAAGGAPAEAAAAARGTSGRQGLRTSKVPRAGTWLSPLKVGQAARVEGAPTPSPQSHIKAVFKDDRDIQFYLPFSGGWAGGWVGRLGKSGPRALCRGQLCVVAAAVHRSTGTGLPQSDLLNPPTSPACLPGLQPGCTSPQPPPRRSTRPGRHRLPRPAPLPPRCPLRNPRRSTAGSRRPPRRSRGP